MEKKRKVWAIIPAGGIGERMGCEIPKQYLKIHGVPILHHTISRICECPDVDGVAIGISEDDRYWVSESFENLKIVGTYQGGVLRSDTVLNGMKYLHSVTEVAPDDWVLVHDAVRPCILQQDLKNLIRCANKNMKGAVLGGKLIDTLKAVNEVDAIQKTMDRERCWRAFTPQMFPIDVLMKAMETAIGSGQQLTDESMAMERLGVYPQLIEGHSSNIKITTPLDIELMEMLLKKFQ